MKIKLLGSAAAECIPALWCECDTCQYARKYGGKDVRRRTSYLIDDDILIDYGPDIFWQVTEFNIDLRKIKHIFFTHSHCDHMNSMDLFWRTQTYFSQVSTWIDIYGDEAVENAIMRDWFCNNGQDMSFENALIRFHKLFAGDTVNIPGLEVLALQANHNPREKPLLYILTRNGKSVFIANDTGMFSGDTWKLLAGRHIDAMIIDCTGGIHPEFGHNTDCHSGAFTDVEIRRRMIDMGCLAPSAPVIINHFSHNANSLHQEMVDLMEPQGITVGYDGLEIKL